MRQKSFLPFVIVLAACTPDPVVDTDAGGGGGTDAPVGAGIDAPGLGGESFTLTFPTINVAAGEEDTQCVIMRLGNPSPINVGRIVNILGEGSHHFIVYRTNDTVERTEPFACTPFLDTLDPAAGSPLMITQIESETLTLPSGVAFPFAANQMIRLEMHFVNTGVSGGPIDVSATSTFHTIADADFRDAADFLFIGTPDINIPAHTTRTVGPVFFNVPAELEPAAGPLNFFSITGHTHRFGTNVLISTAESAAAPGTPIYDEVPYLWDEPPVRYYDPGFTIPDGGGFQFSCDYDNTSDGAVRFGESTNEEMCFFWAYYYPSIGDYTADPPESGARVCIHTEQTGSPVDTCCPGGAFCSLISDFLGG